MGFPFSALGKTAFEKDTEAKIKRRKVKSASLRRRKTAAIKGGRKLARSVLTKRFR